MKNRFRLSRGPLRWWLLACGLLLATYDPTRMIIGLALVSAGAALHLAAKACLWQNRILSTSGPYRFTRNPFYLANLAIDAGLLLVIGHAWLAGVLALLWALVYWQTIASEERTLRGLFGESYAEYCRQVPRLIPRPWRYLSAQASTGPAWTWRNPNLVTGTEWPRVLRILSCPWMLACAGGLRGPWLDTHGIAPAMAAGIVAVVLWGLGEAIAWRIGRRKHELAQQPG
jgi:hypothetical protein